MVKRKGNEDTGPWNSAQHIPVMGCVFYNSFLL